MFLKKRGWSKTEIDILKRYYFKKGPKKLTALLKKPYKGILYKASKLKIKANPKIKNKNVSLGRIRLFKSKKGDLVREKLKKAAKKFNFEGLKNEILYLYCVAGISGNKIASFLGVCPVTIIKWLKKNGIIIKKKGNKCKEWSSEDILYVEKNYEYGDLNEMSRFLKVSKRAIIKKARRLGLYKKDVKQRQIMGTIKFNKTNNPSWRPEVRKIFSERMKKLPIEQNIMYKLKRNKKTNIEKKIEFILRKNNLSFIYNTHLKLRDRFVFPDFLINNLIIEADGLYFHQNKNDKKERDKSILYSGYNILHFSCKTILYNCEKVERCILKKLNQLNQ
jgi:very-short-patch-repair endonuclease